MIIPPLQGAFRWEGVGCWWILLRQSGSTGVCLRLVSMPVLSYCRQGHGQLMLAHCLCHIRCSFFYEMLSYTRFNCKADFSQLNRLSLFLPFDIIALLSSDEIL